LTISFIICDDNKIIEKASPYNTFWNAHIQLDNAHEETYWKSKLTDQDKIAPYECLACHSSAKLEIGWLDQVRSTNGNVTQDNVSRYWF